MKIIFASLAFLLLLLAGCATPPANPEFSTSAGASEQIESAQVQVGHGQDGAPDYQQVLSDPGPF